MKKSILLSIVLIASTAALQVRAAVTSFYDLSPAKQSIDGVSYPRNHSRLYRGTSDNQMNLEKAIKAMMGDPEGFTETLLFSTIKAEILNQAFPRAVALSTYIKSEIQSFAQKNKNPTGVQAAQETARIIDRTFDYMAQDQLGLQSRYTDYTSPNYIDWPQDVVFTSLISPAAATYGDRMLIISEKKPRSLDLNFWNKVSNGNWFVHARDSGEFIAYGYLFPHDLIGYQIRTGSDKAWHQIQLAFYQVDQNSILVFSGKREVGDWTSCIDLNKSDNTYYHCKYRPGAIAHQPPPVGEEKPKLLGVIVKCNEQQKKCSQPPLKEIQKYEAFPNAERISMPKLNFKFEKVTTQFLPVGRLDLRSDLQEKK